MTTPTPSSLTSAPGPTWSDRVSLWMLKLAKLGRKQMADQSKDYDDFYEEFFDEKDRELYEKDRRLVVRRETLNAAVARRVPAGGRILDVGCGLGDVLGGLPPGYELHGMDYAASNVKAATRRLAGKATIARGSIYEIPAESNRFDAAICLEVLEHIEDDARGVRDIARVLKPGGVLIAAVPYTFYWPQYKQLMGHFRHYTRASFSELMNLNGLQTVEYLPNFPNWHRAYTRRYASIRGQSILFGRLFFCRGIYRFKWPWRRTPAIDRLATRLEPLRQRDAAMDYATLPTSTFLIAQKPL